MSVLHQPVFLFFLFNEKSDDDDVLESSKLRDTTYGHGRAT